MARLNLTIWLLIAAILSWPAHTFAQTPAPEKRVALVIGNGAYRTIGSLPNPRSDATLIGTSLQRAGFEVTSLQEQDLNSLNRALLDFRRKADAADVAVVYFAGHGVAVGGINYLLPVDVNAEKAEDLDFSAIDANKVVAAVRGAKRVRIVILDACRDNPFQGRQNWAGANRNAFQRGLEMPSQPASDRPVFVLLAAAPGQKAQDGPTNGNSPFAQSLAELIINPATTLARLPIQISNAVTAKTNGQQRPDQTGIIAEPDWAFMVAAIPTPAPAKVIIAPPTPIVDPVLAELDLWRGVNQRNTASDFQAYLDKYPNGQFAALARSRMALLGNRRTPINTISNITPATVPPLPAGASANVRRQYERARTGNGTAMNEIGLALETGIGATRNEAQASRWYIIAISKNVVVARVNLGRLYRDGRGVQKDERQAIVLLRGAAEANNPEGMVSLAYMLLAGQGVAKNEGEGALWMRRAAEAGNSDAMVGLGNALFYGTGVSKNEAEAALWYQRAIDLGNYTGAMDTLGVMLANGVGVTQDIAAATRLFKRAADLGEVNSMINLAASLSNGINGARDPQEALRWAKAGLATTDPVARARAQTIINKLATEGYR
jgi:uncharacterized protein